MIESGIRTQPADASRAVTDEYIKAENLHYKIMRAAQHAQQSLYEMCAGFKEMRNSKLYKELGYSDFEDYCENEVGVTRRQVYIYIYISIVAYATERPDGRLNLYKFPKAKFMPEGEDSRQRTGSQVNYGTARLKGTYSPLLSSHDDCFKKYGVDPVKDKAVIEEWFSTPEPTLEETPEEDNTDDAEVGE